MDNNKEDDDLVYVIGDIDNFIDTTRKIIFSGFGQELSDKDQYKLDELMNNLTKQDQEELDKTLSRAECLSIIHQYVTPRKTKRNGTKYIISEEIFNTIIEDFNSRLVSNLLNILVQQGTIESGFCSESNDFVFWVKETGTNN